MSQAVISNNQSIKIDQFVINYSQTTISGGGFDIYTVAANEYIELNFASLGNAFSALRIKYQNGDLFEIIPYSTGQYIGQPTSNIIILSPGTKLNVINVSAVPVPVFATGVKFINSP